MQHRWAIHMRKDGCYEIRGPEGIEHVTNPGDFDDAWSTFNRIIGTSVLFSDVTVIVEDDA